MKILAVDTKKQYLSIYERVLKEYLGNGGEIVTTDNAVQARSYLREDLASYKFAIIDGDLNGKMNGLELVSLLKNDDKFIELPIIMTSYNSSSAYMNKAFKSGAILFGKRPLIEQTLLSIVKALTDLE